MNYEEIDFLEFYAIDMYTEVNPQNSKNVFLCLVSLETVEMASLWLPSTYFQSQPVTSPLLGFHSRAASY